MLMLQLSATTASFCSVVKRRRRATPVMISTLENVSDIGIAPGLSLGPPAKAGVRSNGEHFTPRCAALCRAPAAQTVQGCIRRSAGARTACGRGRRLTPRWRISRLFIRSIALMIAALHSASEKKLMFRNGFNLASRPIQF